jgi:hypothetical protein
MKINKANIIIAIINICLLEALILFIVLRINFFKNVPSQNSNALLMIAEEEQNINLKEQELKRFYNITD